MGRISTEDDLYIDIQLSLLNQLTLQLDFNTSSNLIQMLTVLKAIFLGSPEA